MASPLDLTSAAEAAGRLGISRASLYAYVSRGLIRSFSSPRDPRERLYALDDVEALVRRRIRLRRPVVAAATALDWGLPVLETSLTRIDDGRLFYRGIDAIEFSERATLEGAARLLVGGLRTDPFDSLSPAIEAIPAMAAGSKAFLTRAIGLLSAPGPKSDGPEEIATVLRLMAAAGAGSDPERRPIHH